MTYSVYDIKVDNSLSFNPGPTAGSVLAINSNGTTYWTQGVGGGISVSPFITLTDSSTVSWNIASGSNAILNLVGTNRSLSITGATNGTYGLLIVRQGPTSSGNYINIPGRFQYGTYSLSVLGTQSDMFTFVFDGTDFWWNYNKYFI